MLGERGFFCRVHEVLWILPVACITHPYTSVILGVGFLLAPEKTPNNTSRHCCSGNSAVLSVALLAWSPGTFPHKSL